MVFGARSRRRPLTKNASPGFSRQGGNGQNASRSRRRSPRGSGAPADAVGHFNLPPEPRVTSTWNSAEVKCHTQVPIEFVVIVVRSLGRSADRPAVFARGLLPLLPLPLPLLVSRS